MRRLRGICPALVTPFNEDGSVDHGALGALVDRVIEGGVNGIYACGTTGEFALLDESERRAVAETVVRRAQGRVTVYVQVGDARTDRAVAFARHAQEIGADGVGAVTPYYFGYSDLELKEYYARLCEAVGEGFPIYLYNIPARSTNVLRPSLVRDLAKAHGNLLGLKDSSGSMLSVNEILVLTEGMEFDVLQGADEQLLAGLALGCAGSVTGNGNLFPGLFASLWHAFTSGDLSAARTYQRRVSKLAAVLGYGNIPIIKYVLQLQGIGNGRCRPPFGPVPTEVQQRVEELLGEELKQSR